MCKKDIIAMLSLAMLGLTTWDIQDYNSQSQALLSAKVDKKEYETNTDKVKEIVDECEKNKREEYVNQKVEELRAEKERIRLEEEQRKREEEERLRQEELQRQQQEQQVASRGGDVENIIYCKFEVSFYTTSPDEGSGTGLGASGQRVIAWQSIALPKEMKETKSLLIK